MEYSNPVGYCYHHATNNFFNVWIELHSIHCKVLTVITKREKLDNLFQNAGVEFFYDRFHVKMLNEIFLET